MAASTSSESYSVVVRVTAEGSDNYNSGYKDITMNVTVGKATVSPPTNVSIDCNGNVTWTTSSNATGYQISIDNSTWTDATSGVNYLSTIQASTGSRTVYVRAVNSDTTNYNSPSTAATASTTVYQVSYNSCGSTSSLASQYKLHGCTLNLHSDELTKDEYTFKGWSNASNCSEATSVIYAPGGAYTTNENITLYAVWKENENVAYAAYSPTEHVLAFFRSRSNNPNYENFDDEILFTGFESEVYTSASQVPWSSYVNDIYGVLINSDYVISPVSTAYWFSDMRNLTEVNLSNLNTSNVTNMSYMFLFAGYNASTFSLDLSGWDTSSVTDMSYMFDHCSVKTIYVSDLWSTTMVTNSTNMFRSCNNLVGGAGTVFNSSYTDATRARIDGGVGNEGYLT